MNEKLRDTTINLLLDGVKKKIDDVTQMPEYLTGEDGVTSIYMELIRK